MICKGQNKIIYRGSFSTYIFDIKTRQHKVIDTTLYYGEKLVGVKVVGDSIKCHYSKNGKVFVKTYDISQYGEVSIKTKNEFIYTPKYDSYYKHNFYFKNYRFVDYSAGIAILKDNEVLWNSSKATPFNKILDKGYKPYNNSINSNPIISPDEKYILYVACKNNFLILYSKLYEVEINTGKRQLISKDGLRYNPSYSSDGRYILYIRHSNLCMVYDRENQKNLLDYGLEDAFWLYRED